MVTSRRDRVKQLEPGRNGHKTNGHMGKGRASSPIPRGDEVINPSRERILSSLIDEGRLRPDEVVIGHRNYDPENPVETGSWADVAKLVSGVKWLVKGWIPYHMLTGIIGDPKAGKSAFLLWGVIRSIVTGKPFFTGTYGPKRPGYVVYCDTEQSGALNVQRMKDWGLPMERIKTPFASDDPFQPINLDDEDHMIRLRGVVSQYKAHAVVVDSYRGSHKGDENNSRIATGLQALAAVGQETGAAILVIHHTKKMTIGEDMTINAARGSNAFLAAVRCQIAIDIPDPAPDHRDSVRRVQVIGENLGIAPQPVGFKFTSTGLAMTEAPKRPPKEEKGTKTDTVIGWLLGRLEPGKEYPASDLLKEAEAMGLSRGTVERAQKTLGIEVRKDGKRWIWQRQDITISPAGRR
jgi:hypothetical protein